MSPRHATSRPCSVPGREKISFNADEELIAEYARAMSDLIRSYQKATNYDSRSQLDREVRVLTTCFTKQIETQAKAMASQSPLLVEKRAYSERAGHAPQLPQSFERSETTTDQCHVEVVEDQQNAVHQRAVVVVIDERDSELVHPIGRGLCSGNPRHSDELDTFTSSPRQPSLKNNRNHLSNGDWRLDDGRRCFKISRSNALPVG
jgi:hypothetical protein